MPRNTSGSSKPIIPTMRKAKSVVGKSCSKAQQVTGKMNAGIPKTGMNTNSRK